MDEDVKLEICQLAYNSWADMVSHLMLVKLEKTDNSPDWVLFHQARVRNSEANVDKAARILQQVKLEFAPQCGIEV